jgi:hypothetical protein
MYHELGWAVKRAPWSPATYCQFKLFVHTALHQQTQVAG